MCLKCFKVLRQTGDTVCRAYITTSRQDVNEMPDWEIQPKKHKYEVGERVLVRPAIIDCIWAKTSCRKTVPATVIFVHPDDRFIVAEYQVCASFFGRTVSTIRESFLIPKVQCLEWE